MWACETTHCFAGPSSARRLGVEALTSAESGRSCVQVNGGEWDHKLLFSVPTDHPEVQRLEGRYKRSAALALPQPICRLPVCWPCSRAGMASPPGGCAPSRATARGLPLCQAECSAFGYVPCQQYLPLTVYWPACSQGGLKKDMLVELANQSVAMVVEITGRCCS